MQDFKNKGSLKLVNTNNAIERLRARYQECGTLFLSFPKSGRTWIRFFITKYLALKYDIPEDIEFSEKSPNIVPFEFSHNYFDIFRYVEGKPQILLADEINPKRLVVLVRDPRDVMVSYYYHIHSRDRIWQHSIVRFIFSKIFGIERQASFVLKLLSMYEGHQNTKLLVKYEDLKVDPVNQFRSILQMILKEPVDEEVLLKAIEASSFQKMLQVELAVSQGGISDNVRLGVPNWDGNPNALKVRKGESGGYKKELKTYLRIVLLLMPNTRCLIKKLSLMKPA